MPRLTSARPRRRPRSYDIGELLHQQVMGAAVIRIRPTKRLFRQLGRLHF